jgi:hypothetical protein
MQFSMIAWLSNPTPSANGITVRPRPWRLLSIRRQMGDRNVGLERVQLKLNRGGFPTGREYDSGWLLEEGASMHGTSFIRLTCVSAWLGRCGAVGAAGRWRRPLGLGFPRL